MPPWVFPLRGFLPRMPTSVIGTRLSPHAFLQPVRTLTGLLTPLGKLATVTQPISLKTSMTPLRFSTSLTFSMLWGPRRIGLCFTLGRQPALPQVHYFRLTLLSGPGLSLPRRPYR